MKRLLKWVAGIVGILVLLLVVAIIVVPLYFDPNDYRGKIIEVVQDKTGRELAIDGDIELSLFPWIGVEVNQVQLGNAAGFGPEPFARVERADIRVKLLPLLRKEVEMDTAVLAGLRLNLARDAEGRTNWDDLAGAAEAEAEKPDEPATEEPSGAAPLAGLAIGGVEVTDAQVVWDDALEGSRAEVRNLNLESGALASGEPFPFQVAFELALTEPEVSGRVSLASRLTVDPEAQTYAAENLKLDTDLTGPLFPTGRLQATATGSASADMEAETATVRDLGVSAYGAEVGGRADLSRLSEGPDAEGQLTVRTGDPKALAALLAHFGLNAQADALAGSRVDAGFRLALAEGTATLEPVTIEALGITGKANAKATGLNTEPAVAGRLELAPFVARDTLAGLGIELPPMADPNTLTKAALATDFEAGTDRAGLKGLKLQFDDTTLTGDASVRQFAAPVIRFGLEVDGIDVDRYLPPPEEGEAQQAATPAGAAAAGAAQLPLETLRALDIDGSAAVGTLKAANLRSDDVRLTVRAKNGVFRAHPASARLYDGTYQGDVTFDVRQDTPRVGMNEKLTGVQAGPLLEDLMGEAKVVGTASVSAKLTARGIEPESIKKSLNGTAAFEFRDGAVNGINIAEMIRKALAARDGGEAPAEGEQKTDFAELKGSLAIKDGLVRNDDLSAKSPLLRVEGKGTANLVSEKIDYRVRAAIVGTLEGQGGKELEQLRGLTIPVRITGTFEKPKFAVDIGSALEERAKAAVEEEKAKAKEEVKERVEQEKEKLREGVEEELKDKLKGLFGR